MGSGVSAGASSAIKTASKEDLQHFITTLPAASQSKVLGALAALDEESIWYFAIGSMTNPTSLHARALSPLKSLPAKLLDHRLKFQGPEGMASQEQVAGENFHGVLHLLTSKDMKTLDGIEMGYDRVSATAQLYDGTHQPCTVYSMSDDRLRKIMGKKDGEEIFHNTPQRRYIDIIAEGCKHFGVDQEYIQWLQNQPCRERTSPEAYLRFEIPDGTPLMSLEDVAKGDGLGGNHIRRVMNNKVVQYCGPNEGAFYSRSLKEAGSAEDMLFSFSKMLYDPLFGLPSTPEEMTTEHFAYREDMLKQMCTTAGFPDIWKVIGVLT